MIAVKICGITRLDDGLAAIEAGADALGFVFAPSPRQVTLEQAAEIAARLDPVVARVGVFVNPDGDELRAAVRMTGLDAVQVHGLVPDDLPEEALFIPVRRCRDESALDRMPADGLFLLDRWHPTLHGGTGRTVDRDLAAHAARRGPMILAGGLTPDNVAGIVQTVRPQAVDVSSGLETAPGRKDHQKINRFLQEIRLCNFPANKAISAPSGAALFRKPSTPPSPS